MSAFLERFSSRLVAHYQRLGEAASYCNLAEVVTPCRVIVDRDLSTLGEELEVQGATALISVRISELPERPKKRAEFVLDDTGERFTVADLLSSDDFEHRALVV